MLTKLISFVTGRDFALAENVRRIFSDIPSIETERLLLRRIEPRDTSDMFEYSNNPVTTKFLTWTPHTSVEQTAEYIQFLQKKYADGRFYDWGLEYKQDHRFIGTCGFTSIDVLGNTAEIGYVLSNRYWGMGLMPEAVSAVLYFGFVTIGFERIIAKFMNGNTNSCRVMQKCGMTFEKTLKDNMFIKGEYKTIHIFSITREKFLEGIS